jgi:hypothetical protein
MKEQQRAVTLSGTYKVFIGDSDAVAMPDSVLEALHNACEYYTLQGFFVGEDDFRWDITEPYRCPAHAILTWDVNDGTQFYWMNQDERELWGRTIGGAQFVARLWIDREQYATTNKNRRTKS